MKQYIFYVYILSTINDAIFYVGVTNNVERRIYEHKNKLVKGFSSKYNVDKLVYYEIFQDINAAIAREKQLKNWHREWKLNLVKSKNPELKDLADELGTITNLLMLDPETSSG